MEKEKKEEHENGKGIKREIIKKEKKKKDNEKEGKGQIRKEKIK